MKKGMNDLAKKAVEDIVRKPISRKDAIKKTGYIALSAATMMLLLSSPAHACGSHKSSNDQGQQSNTNQSSGIWKNK